MRTWITEHDGRGERRAELLDETVNPPRMVQRRTANVTMSTPEHTYRRALFNGTFAGILGGTKKTRRQRSVGVDLRERLFTLRR